MLAIYRYTFFKYSKSLSTWVILFFSSIVVGFIVGGLVPFIAIKVNDSNAGTQYIRAVVGATSGVVVFLAVFASVFAGFKSATMFKDEIENGTFLLIISKPIARSTILIGKWLALQTLLLIYAFVSVFCFCVGLIVFDKGGQISSLVSLGIEPISNNAGLVGVFVFFVIYIACLIFSSIGILLSTRISVAATIGIMIAIGVIIPMTSLLGLFLSLNPATPVTATNPEAVNSRLLNERNSTLNFLKSNDLREPQFHNLGAFDGASDVVIKDLYRNYDERTNELIEPNNNLWIYNAGRRTGDVDSYDKAWPFDLNYHFSLMAEFAYEKAISFEKRFAASGLFQGSYSVQTIISSEPSTGDLLNALRTYYQSTNGATSRLAQARAVSFMVRTRSTIFNRYGNMDRFTNPLELMIEDTEEVRDTLRQFLTTQGLQPDPKVVELRDAFVIKSGGVNDGTAFPPTVAYSFEDLEKLIAFALMFDSTDQIDKLNLLDIMDYNIFLLKPTSATAPSDNLLWLHQKLILSLGNLASRMVAAAIDLEVDKTSESLTLDPKPTNDLSTWQNATYGLNWVLLDQSAPAVSNIFNSSASIPDTILYSRFERALRSANQSAFKVPFLDLARLDNLITLSERQEVVEYKVNQYADKNLILVGYLVVAFGLLPITYPLVRRQDFR